MPTEQEKPRRWIVRTCDVDDLEKVLNGLDIAYRRNVTIFQIMQHDVQLTERVHGLETQCTIIGHYYAD